MKTAFKISFLLFIFSSSIFAQQYKERLRTLNIQHYKLAIELNDENNTIDAKMAVDLRFRKSIPSFYLDLVNFDSISGKGMKVDSVFQNKVAVKFKQADNKLTIYPKHNFANLTYTYTIKYSGIPEDGLIIGENAHGDRTFFGDNWPNRAHNWFPCIDHPSDKATIEYIVKAPKRYKVIANGELIEEIDLNEKTKQTHWKTAVPLPTKVMVIGAANFAIDSLEVIDSIIPVTSWVYPQTKEKGFHDLENSKEILQFYINLFGEYPYQKLASVQSATRYGGMENASCIFYPEQAFTGEQKFENTIAHEIVHQWFGNSASEIDWPHVWLSEGFATYFTDIYIQETKGDSIFKERMQQERSRVLKFYETTKTPVVDVKTTDYMKLLNPNSYQKGAWVLHMLRKKIGDEAFYKGVKTYYQNYKYKSASTNSFKRVMASISEKNLDLFFKQWLENPGHPVLKTQWLYFNNRIRIIIEQVQGSTFEFPLDVQLIYEDGTSEIKTIQVDSSNTPYSLETSGDVKEIKFDPNTWLLFDLEEE